MDDILDDVTEIGIIYRITNIENNKEYYGLSVDTLAERRKGHKCAARRNKEGWSSGCRKLYNAMNKYGFDKFEFKVMLEVPVQHLPEAESFHIWYYNSLHPHGYNLTTGGEFHRHHDQTKKLISKKGKHHPNSVGLPMYVTFKQHYKYGNYRIMDHPLCKFKAFSEHKYGSLEAAKLACLEFLKTLEESQQVHQQILNKKDPFLPKGISKVKNGYRVGKTYHKILYEKSFCSKAQSDAEKRQAALS